MAENTPNKYFLSHLAQVSKTNEIVVKDNILNDRGKLVASAGTKLDVAAAKKIAQHKLSQPLEQTTRLSYSLTKARLVELFTHRLNTKGLLDASQSNGLYQDAPQLFPLVTKYSLIADKLTIFADRFPERFGTVLTTSVLAAGIAKEAGLSAERIGQVFIANLVSDLGLLHVDPVIVEKGTEELSEQELKLFQGHVVISAHFADMVPGLPKIVVRAILEHHERADGFGYPRAKRQPNLCIEGQIVSIASRITTFFEKLITKSTYSLGVMQSILQVPTSSHIPEVHNAMLRLIKSGKLPYKPAFDLNGLKNLLTKTFQKLARLNLWFDMYSTIYEQHSDILTDTARFKPWALLYQLQNNIDETGVLNHAQKEWLLELDNTLTMASSKELEEFYLLLDEVEQQCFFVMRQLFSQRSEIEALFGESELPEAYYSGLISILRAD